MSPNSDDCELATEYVCSLLSGEDGIAKFKGQLVPRVVIGSFQMLRLFSCRGIVHSPQHRKKGLFLEAAFSTRASITRWPPGLSR